MIRLALQPESDPLEGADIMSYRLLSPTQIYGIIRRLNHWAPGFDVRECTFRSIKKDSDRDQLLINLEQGHTTVMLRKTPLFKEPPFWRLTLGHSPNGPGPEEMIPGTPLTVGQENVRKIAQRVNRLGVETRFVKTDIYAEIPGAFTAAAFFRLCLVFVLLDRNYPVKFSLQEFIAEG